jgi:cobalt/nickel transport system permease protein
LHVPDGFVNPCICAIMFVVAALFLIWAWRGARLTLRKSFVALIAISSAVVLIVQMIEFPAAGGASTWHIMGGTILTMVLGPHGTIISMTLTLIIQALYGDGGISTFGVNVVNMAIIGGLSFYLVRALAGKNISRKRLAFSLFLASLMSNILTALAVGIDIGLYPMVGTTGGLIVTIPTMLVLYIPTGLIEGIVTSSLVITLSQIKSIKLFGLELLGNAQKINVNSAP